MLIRPYSRVKPAGANLPAEAESPPWNGAVVAVMAVPRVLPNRKNEPRVRFTRVEGGGMRRGQEGAGDGLRRAAGAGGGEGVEGPRAFREGPRPAVESPDRR